MAATGPMGFIGLGIMGYPMAQNLINGGGELVVWNRSTEKSVDLSDKNPGKVTVRNHSYQFPSSRTETECFPVAAAVSSCSGCRITKGSYRAMRYYVFHAFNSASCGGHLLWKRR